MEEDRAERIVERWNWRPVQTVPASTLPQDRRANALKTNNVHCLSQLELFLLLTNQSVLTKILIDHTLVIRALFQVMTAEPKSTL